MGLDTIASQTSILVVEDDRKLQALLQEYLSSQSFDVAVVSEGAAAIEYISRNPPEVVVLDLMLPGIDGLEICRRIRQSFRGGILMLTALKSDTDQVVGLELGADDYVTKPVEPRVLVARIRSILRRLRRAATENAAATGERAPSPTDASTSTHQCGPLRIDRTARTAWVNDAALKFTSVEFEILWMLADSAGEVVTRETLYDEVRGTPYDGIDRSIDIHVSRIRRKLRNAGLAADSIRAIRGSGYVLVVSA